MANERATHWLNLLKSNGCIKGNRIVAPQNGSLSLAFNHPHYLSTDSSILEFNDAFVIGKAKTAVTFRYDTYHLWQDITSVTITAK